MTTPLQLRPDHRPPVTDVAAVNIVPALAAARESNDSQQAKRSNPNACQSCVRRKVRCDKISPVCSSCIKAKFECHYNAPLPPQRGPKRRRGTADVVDAQELLDQLERCKRALLDHGLLDSVRSGTSSAAASPSHQQNGNVLVVSGPRGCDQQVSVQAAGSKPSRTGSGLCHGEGVGISTQSQLDEIKKSGKLIAGDGKFRYIHSQIWLDAGDADMVDMSEHDQDHEEKKPEQEERPAPAGFWTAPDPLSGALLGLSHNLVAFHPSPYHALKLWTVHVRNVEPLCKVLHIPTMERLIQTVCQQPATATKAQNCLLFSIYHFAVFSLDNAECELEFGQPRSVLLRKYEFATRQALVDGFWLRTTDILVLQALVLHLIAIRGKIDPHTFWILTGVAVRIAQRMGLYRDGDSLGLSPYDVEIRRRLFWQLVPLDTYAGQISGTGISIPPNSWNTKQPLNINDDQIYPGMVTPPEEQSRASDMLFCRTRAELSNFYAQTGVKAKQMGPTIDLRESTESDKLIDETEDIIEVRYLRYCDLLNPLHVFTLGVVRSAANVVRLRNRITLLMQQEVSDERRRESCVLARKILNTDNALYRDPNLKGFRWQMKTHFLWDSLICVLMSLTKPGFFSAAELDTTWNMLTEVYSNHAEIIEGKGAIQLSIARATLVAWRAQPRLASASQPNDEPSFIVRLRQLQHHRKGKDSTSRGPADGTDACTMLTATTAGSPHGNEDAAAEVMASLGTLSGNLDGAEVDYDGEFDMNPADWIFWNQFLPPGPEDAGFS